MTDMTWPSGTEEWPRGATYLLSWKRDVCCACRQMKPRVSRNGSSQDTRRRDAYISCTREHMGTVVDGPVTWLSHHTLLSYALFAGLLVLPRLHLRRYVHCITFERGGHTGDPRQSLLQSPVCMSDPDSEICKCCATRSHLPYPFPRTTPHQLSPLLYSPFSNKTTPDTKFPSSDEPSEKFVARRGKGIDASSYSRPPMVNQRISLVLCIMHLYCSLPCPPELFVPSPRAFSFLTI
jgi:hypothetical protein